jgi:hypothetical protein
VTALTSVSRVQGLQLQLQLELPHLRHAAHATPPRARAATTVTSATCRRLSADASAIATAIVNREPAYLHHLRCAVRARPPHARAVTPVASATCRRLLADASVIATAIVDPAPAYRASPS